MQENQIAERRYEEDEIDLRELFKTIWRNKFKILGITTVVTTLAIVYTLVKTPIFEAKAIVEIGSYKDIKNDQKLLDNSEKLSQELNILYIDILKNVKDREAWIESISTLKKQKNFIKVTSQAVDNDKTINTLNEVVGYIIKKHSKYIDEVLNEKTIELKNIDREIELLKSNSLVSINEDIKYIKSVKIVSLEEKLSISKQKLEELKKQLKITQINISKTQSKNPSLTALNVMEKRSLETEISNLKLNLVDLSSGISTIQDKTLPRLLRSKSKLIDIDLKMLEEKRHLLEQSLLPHNYKNSKIIGNIILNDHPVKPKKTLIVVVAFVTGFILSIFLVFFLEFIKGFNVRYNEDE